MLVRSSLMLEHLAAGTFTESSLSSCRPLISVMGVNSATLKLLSPLLDMLFNGR